MAFTAIAGLVTAVGSAAYGMGSGMMNRKKQRQQQKEYANNIEAALESRETSREGNADAMMMAKKAADAAKYLRGQMAVNGDSTEAAAAGVEKIGNSVANEAAQETQAIRNDIRQDSNVRMGLQKEIHQEQMQEQADKRAAISQAVQSAGDVAGKIFGMTDAGDQDNYGAKPDASASTNSASTVDPNAGTDNPSETTSQVPQAESKSNDDMFAYNDKQRDSYQSDELLRRGGFYNEGGVA